MQKQITFILLFLLLSGTSIAQVSISNDGSPPDNAAMLDVKSTGKGLLPPRMTTTQMYAIASPAAGLMIFNTTVSAICWFNGTTWQPATNHDGKVCYSIFYEGKSYSAVIIGMQCWMTQNLNAGVAILGSQDQTNNGTIEKYCYDNNTANCDVYGGLYQWAEVVQYLNGATNTNPWNPAPAGTVQGICPLYFHLPTDAEWTSLSTYLGGEAVAGGKMREAGTTHWAAPNTGATNSSGFAALPGGYRYNASFGDLTTLAYYWSVSVSSPQFAWSRITANDGAALYRVLGSKDLGFSVRCCKD